MARMARDSTPKRRSARLSKDQPQSIQKSNPATTQLDAVAERDETPDTGGLPSIHKVVATPTSRRDIENRLRELSKITTPKTEPRLSEDQMHPATVHATTAKAPDSGLKLGFADISTTGRASVASLQNTPSRPRQSLARTNISPTFKFKFNHETDLSDEGRKMMESIREDAAKIKEQLRAEKAQQETNDNETREMLESANGRRIAKPTAKAGRFSDVHMAQFKKMDSIENHASSFRARPDFTRPTAQSLKRSSSKASLDEPERPRTAGKSSPTRVTPPIIGRPVSTSPFKSIHPAPTMDANIAAKRPRHEGDKDVSNSKTSTIPRPVSSRFLSPTKASAARVVESAATPVKSSTIPRTNSVKSIRSIPRVSGATMTSPSKHSTLLLEKSLPAVLVQDVQSPVKHARARSNSSKSVNAPKESASSKIPALASLRSILRSPRKDAVQDQATTPKHSSVLPIPASSPKKVDFTPSVKSRYAVKLAEASPSPAKMDRSRGIDVWKPAIPYDSSAFAVSYDEDWENDSSSVVYPDLPSLSPGHSSQTTSGPVDHTLHNFTQKAKAHGRRESKEFKSIFTTLHPKPDISSLTSVNTNLNKTNPITNAAKVVASPPKPQQSASSIRHIQTSEPVLPFEDRIQTVPHGLPGKKRRMEFEAENDKFGNDDDAKENRRVTYGARIPGAWSEGFDENEEDEGEKRGGKRAKVTRNEEFDKQEVRGLSPAKKPSATRKLAVKSAKDRKAKASISGNVTGNSRGVLSLSRLNMLARPKTRS